MTRIERLYIEGNDQRPIETTSLIDHICALQKIHDILDLPEISDDALRFFYEYQLSHPSNYWKPLLDFDVFKKEFQAGIHSYIGALRLGKDIYHDDFSLSKLGNLMVCSFAETLPGVKEFDIMFGHLFRAHYPLSFLSRRNFETLDEKDVSL